MKYGVLLIVALLALAVPLAAQTPPAAPAPPAQNPPAGQAPPAAPRRPAAPSTRTPRPAAAAMINRDVIRMVAVGLPDDVIINAIRQAPKRNFTLTPDALIGLKQGKVSDAIIRVMQAPTTEAPTPSDAVSAGGLSAPPPSPAAPPPPPPPVEVVLRKGETVKVQLKTLLSSQTARAGDRVEFEVVDDVAVDGRVFLTKGSPAAGTITEVIQQRRSRPGKLEFNVESARTVNGATVRLAGKQGAEGARGVEVTFRAASQFSAVTEEDIVLRLPQP